MKLIKYVFSGFLFVLFICFVVLLYIAAPEVIYSGKSGVHSKRVIISSLNIYALNKKALFLLSAQSKCEEPTLNFEFFFHLSKERKVAYSINDIECRKNIRVSLPNSEIEIPILEKIEAIEVASNIELSNYEIRWYSLTP